MMSSVNPPNKSLKLAWSWGTLTQHCSHKILQLQDIVINDIVFNIEVVPCLNYKRTSPLMCILISLQ